MELNDRIELKPFGMVGTVLEIINVKKYAKNYCDGFSRIRLADKKIAIVVWDESPNVKCEIAEKDFKEFSIIN